MYKSCKSQKSELVTLSTSNESISFFGIANETPFLKNILKAGSSMAERPKIQDRRTRRLLIGKNKDVLIGVRNLRKLNLKYCF